MGKRSLFCRMVCLLAVTAALLSGCGPEEPRRTVPTDAAQGEVPAQCRPIPAFQDAVFHEEQAQQFDGLRIDLSCLEQGYVALQAVGESRLKFQIIQGEMKYNYDISNEGVTSVLPLNMGDGEYTLRLMENVGENKYACIWSETCQVKQADEFQCFLRPSDMSAYNEDSACVAVARELAARCTTDTEVASAVYAYLVEHICYDNQKAATVQSGYIPVPDETLNTGKGICFDYASLAAAMMRSVGIPCKLITGYVDQDVYHAWNCFYTREQGWVTVEIRATPNYWQRVDITFAAGGTRAADLMDDTKYTTRFTY